MPTIDDVARVAGVGIGTVSRVLNGSRLVSAATRQRVLDAVQQLGYQPSPIARAFGRRRTHTIEVLVPMFAQSFALSVVRGVGERLNEADFGLIIRTIDDAAERERVLAECCLSGRADGALLLWLSPTDEFIQRVSERAFPTMLVNAEHPHVPSVAVDHAVSTARALTYCMGLGHRRIGLVDRRLDPLVPTTTGLCEAAYRQTLEDAGFAPEEAYARIVDGTPSAGAVAAESLLQLADPPTAILATSELLAVGVLEGARRSGRRVPQDVSVVGYNDDPLVEFLGVTTVSLPLRELGRLATDILLSSMASPKADATVTYLPTDLVVRRTCGPPPSS